MSRRSDLYIPTGLGIHRPDPPQGRTSPEIREKQIQAQPDSVEEVSSPTLFRCWLSHSNLVTLAPSNHQKYPNVIGRTEGIMENQSASRKGWTKPQYAPKGYFYSNKSNLNHLKNIKPLVKNPTNSHESRRQQEATESEIIVTEEVQSETGLNTHSGPLNTKGLQPTDAQPSCSSDSRRAPPNYEPDSNVIVLSGGTEDTGLRIESVFSFSDYQAIPMELQHKVTHWVDNVSKNDGFNMDSDSDDPSIQGIYKQTSTGPVPHHQISTQQSPLDRPHSMDNLKHDCNSYICLVCQKTFRSPSTLHFHVKCSKTHKPGFTQYLRTETPFSERPADSGQGSGQEGAAGSQERMSDIGLLISPTPHPSSPKKPAGLQPLSSSGINSSATNGKVNLEMVVCSGEAEDTELPTGSVCPFNKCHTTPAEFQHSTTDWLNDVPKENEEGLNETLIGESDVTSYLDDVALEVSPWQVPTDPMAHGQTSALQCAEGTSTSAAPVPMGIPKYYPKSYWCSACSNFFRSLCTLQVHVKYCNPHKISRWMCLSRSGPIPEKEELATDQATSEQCRAVAVSSVLRPMEGAPSHCPVSFIPMTKYFYLALADGHNFHVCNICDLWCDDERSLGFHLKIHFWRRNYRCCLCDRAFHTRKSCWRHQAKHSSHPHYRCSRCGRIFSYYKALKLHIRNTHEIDLELADNDTYEDAISKAATYEMIKQASH